MVVRLRSAILWKNIAPGAQTERPEDVGPAGASLGGKIPAGRFVCE
jgi:hypothetical protein